MDVTYTPWYVDSLFEGLAWMVTHPLQSLIGFGVLLGVLLILNKIVSS